jgi:hypothetical protein
VRRSCRGRADVSELVGEADDREIRALLALHLLDAIASGVEHRRGAIVRTEPEAALLLPA